jgi:hypothetical protein
VDSQPHTVHPTQEENLKTSRLVIAIGLLGILLIAGRVMIDSDTWWHLRTGQWILENRQLPGVDSFSFTRAGTEWHFPGWLAEILMYAAYQIAGLAGVNLLFILIALSACLIILRSMQGDPFIRAFILVLAGTSAAVYWSARPQMLSFLFGALFFLSLRSFQQGKNNTLWMLPFVMVVWVNSHGGFAVGFLFLLLAAAGQGAAVLFLPDERNRQSIKRLAWIVGIGLACLAAAMCNPYGAEMLAYPFKTVSMQVLQQLIQEWQSPDFHLLHAQAFLWLMFGTGILLAFSPERPDPRDVLMLVVVAYMGFVSWRNTILLPIVAPAIASTHADAILHKIIPRWNSDLPVSAYTRAVNALVFCVASLAVGISLLTTISPRNVDAVVAERMPVKAVDFLSEHPSPGQTLNAYNWGAYLLWRLPDRPVFVDGRTDVYQDELLGQYLQVMNAQAGWRDVLTRWDIRLVFTEPSAPLLELLRLDGWRTAYQDPQAVILRSPDPD